MQKQEIPTIEETEDPVRATLDDARKDLLDLSLRNKLLNYRPLKTKGVEIIDELPTEVFRILVNEGRSMSFLSIPEEEQEKGNQQALFREEQDIIIEGLGQPEEDENGIALRHMDNKLQSPYISQALQRRLLNTYYAARTYIEEQGVNILFLALGMLHWYESPSSDDVRKAPLILVPVEPSRSNVRSRFRVRYSGDDIDENLSLRAKLQSDFGIKLPEFPEAEDIDINSYFQEISKAIGDYPRWEVDTKAVALGFFSFGKFLMFNDLDSNNWSEESRPERHPILRSLLSLDGFDGSRLEFNDEIEIDTHVSPEEIHHVVDADSSQILAILEVNKGRNLVIQGPPGTGKSQTITNLIAEAIGHEKTVLFVSEKMAALEVVKRRLDQVGLGDACLELHSQKTKKRIVLDELKRSLELGQPKLGAPVDTKQLIRHQARLNGYSKAVNAEIGDSRLTPYEVYGRLIQIKEILSGIELPKLEISAVDTWTSEEVHENLSLVEELQLFINKIGRPVDHPFWGSQVSILLPAKKDHIREQLSNAVQSLDDLRYNSREVSELLLLPEAASTAEIKTMLETSHFVLSAPNLERVKVDSEVWGAKASEIERTLEAGHRIKCLHDVYDKIVRDESWDEDVLELRGLIAHYGPKWWRTLSRSYREAKTRLADLCTKDLPKSSDRQLEILDAILEVNRLTPTVEDFNEEASDLFGARWRGVQSNWEELIGISSWLAGLHRKINEGELPTQIVDFVATLAGSSVLEQENAQLRSKLAGHENATQEAIESLELDQSMRFGEGKTLIDLPLKEQDNHLKNWLNELDRLQEIIALRGLARQLDETGLESVVETSLSWPLAHRHLVDLLQHTWLSMLLERAWVERPILRDFDGEIHELSMRKFCELDTRLLDQNRVQLAYDHWKTLPKHRASGQLGVLYYEFAKKRRHRPIRKLMQEAGNVIQVVKPVFMMSPLSIAKFLPPDTVDFDMVIFDEASQVKPVDAFGAILRGTQVVVVGDDRQLPPTPFFETVIDVDEDYSESEPVNLESILGLSVAQGIPQRMLRWHYRSQHESLITVSNYEFYHNKLVVFPSPDKGKREVGLFYHYLPNTEYDRGKSRKNLGEAKKVAEAIMRHAKTSPDLTLGVAAFSISQTEAIRDQLEIGRRQDVSCEEFFRSHPEEPFFVKNLENVQGDERDVIFISVGYGRTSDGRVSMNFGPLNHEGGERRLNVLITRARKRCEVFTNLKADDIDLGKTRARGVEVLKRFLKYADTGYLDIPIPSGGEVESPFEEAVSARLRQLGHRVEHQVGTGGFFIDLAIVDEDQPGRYLLGIECDGATYHSARSARDRDRLRQEVLENLGWQIHRIWSTDWFRNPGREMQRLEKGIEAAKGHRASEAQSEMSSPHSHVQRAPPIERHKPGMAKRPALDSEPYKTAKPNITLYYREQLHEVSRRRMAAWIKDVVDTESPVHQDEVARRIANCAGVKRIGRRIRTTFELGLRAAIDEGFVIGRGPFLWRPGMKQPKLRSRSGLPNASRHIRLIAPEEIELAISKVVGASYGIQREMIPNEVCKLFGFKRTTSDMNAVVDHIVMELLNDGRIVEDGTYVVFPEAKRS